VENEVKDAELTKGAELLEKREVQKEEDVNKKLIYKTYIKNI
jgi:hypothetical protein